VNRRDVLNCLAAGIASPSLLPGRANSASTRGLSGRLPEQQPGRSPYIVAADGTLLFYQDWGTGKCILFVHSICLSSQIWQYNMVPLSQQGFRCVAYDRRGHGRSTQPGHGYDYDTLADDLACVINQLDLRDVTLVGHSMGAAEVVRYLSRHGTERVARIALVAPGLPFMLKTADNPEAQERSVFEETFASWRKDYPKWVADGCPSFLAPNPSNAQREWVAGLCMQASLKALVDCFHAIIETDFRREVAAIQMPTLIIQGDKDTGALIEFTGRRTAQLIKGSRFNIYPGAPHGLMVTDAERLNSDLAQFAAG
jgi:non-heme chloroperoxidase